jgi:mRNA interferase MazF
LKRGEIWTQAGGPDNLGKPRPAVIIQADRCDATASITICGFTTTNIDAPMFRVPIDPHPATGLSARSFLMVDKITTISRQKLANRIGRLSGKDLARVDQAIVLFLGLAD